MLQQALAIAERTIAILLYAFVIPATFAIVSVLPVFLISSIILRLRTHQCARHIRISVLIAAGFVAGRFLGWSIRPTEQKLRTDTATTAPLTGIAKADSQDALLVGND